jgi:predicted DCC family thiol-disulfide oxidoreductase YuxK
MNKTRVYYNSACPICKAGIESQQCRMAAQEISDVEWLDVHTHPEFAREVGAELEFVRERLHVKAPDGSLRVGADALATLFERTRGQQWLARLLHFPVLRSFAHWAYNRFARLLYRWNRKRRHW